MLVNTSEVNVCKSATTHVGTWCKRSII